MKNMLYVGKISAKNTKLSLFFLFFVWVLFPTFILYNTLPKIFSEKHQLLLLIGLNLFCLATIAFAVYLYLFVSEVEVEENQLIFKKKFRSKKTYTFDKLGIPRSFYIRGTKFIITVDMTNEDGSTEKFLIMNNKSLSLNDDIDTEDVLWSLM